MMLTVNLPDAGRVAGQDPNVGGCSRSTRHHVPFGERPGAERAVMCACLRRSLLIGRLHLRDLGRKPRVPPRYT